jgi:hypothetical protein
MQATNSLKTNMVTLVKILFSNTRGLTFGTCQALTHRQELEVALSESQVCTYVCVCVCVCVCV